MERGAAVPEHATGAITRSAARPGPRLAEFCKHLHNGIDVVKHGRHGRPKRRLLFGFDECDTLYWHANDMAKWSGARSCPLKDVTSVSDGMESSVLRSSGRSDRAPQYVTLHMASRTLDLELDSPEQQAFVAAGLRALVAYHQGRGGSGPFGVLGAVDRARAAVGKLQAVAALTAGPRAGDNALAEGKGEVEAVEATAPSSPTLVVQEALAAGAASQRPRWSCTMGDARGDDTDADVNGDTAVLRAGMVASG